MKEHQDHAPFLERAFGLDLEESAYWIDAIEGEVPTYLRGVYYLNGPARFGRHEVRYQHWLDGDGMVCALRFERDGVAFTNRFVRGTKFCEEEAADRALFRTFGTRFESDRLLRGVGLESPVNVSVCTFAERLLAFGEQGLPWELDPVTLETRGQVTFGRSINAISPFSAHPKICPETGEMFNFGVSFSARHPCINLYRFGKDGRLTYRQRLPIAYPASMHDFSLSPTYVAFYLSPHILDMSALMSGEQTILQSLSWQPEQGSQLVIARRNDGGFVATLPIGRGYCLHLVNAFEREGRLIVDAIELEQPVYDQYDIPELFTEVRTALPRRYVVDVAKGEVEEVLDLDYRFMCDFPAIDPRRSCKAYRDFWVLGISATHEPGRKFFDQIVHCDWQLGRPASIWQAPSGSYLGGEPVFMPNRDDDKAGAVICQLFDAERQTSAFLIFDAFDLARGPLATLSLRRPVHLGFHASYVDQPAGDVASGLTEELLENA